MPYKFNWLDQIAREKTLQVSPEIRQMQAHLWPWSDPFFHPFHQGFAAQLSSTSAFSKSAQFLLRDGIYPLAVYFSRNPEPTSPIELLIPSELSRIVPKAWENQVSYYSIYTQTPAQRPAKSAKPTKLLLSCLLNPAIATIEDIRERLTQFCEAHGKDFSEILLYSPVKIWQGMTEDSYPARAVMEVLACFDKPVTPVNWQTIQNTTSFADTLYFDFTPPKLLSVSYIDHFLASRQATSPRWGKAPDKPEGESIALSKHHGIWITKQPVEFIPTVTDDEIMSTMLSPVSQVIDWVALYASEERTQFGVGAEAQPAQQIKRTSSRDARIQ